jgi:hypothetical protein
MNHVVLMALLVTACSGANVPAFLRDQGPYVAPSDDPNLDPTENQHPMGGRFNVDAGKKDGSS